MSVSAGFSDVWLSMARFSAISVFGAVLSAVGVADEPRTANLEIVVTGIEDLKGDVAIAVFANQADFDARENAVARAFVPADTRPVTWTVDVPAPSGYAILVYHDVNGNREIDFRRIGIPKEPYGFSNNARKIFGPPEFDNARVTVHPDSVRLEIEIR